INTLIASPEIMLRQSELFVRGHEIPWAFSNPMFDAPWATFYFFAEPRTLNPGQAFLSVCQKKGLGAGVQEAGRSFVYNRLPNILYTRDRLLFYEMQQAAAKRARWTRQKFWFEVSYHLNFYYLLLFGGFDHLAVVVNAALALGMTERDVTASG